MGIVGGTIVVATVPKLMKLSIGIQVMNALLLPLVVGLLVALAIKTLPPDQAIRGRYRRLVIGVAVLTAGLGLYFGVGDGVASSRQVYDFTVSTRVQVK